MVTDRNTPVSYTHLDVYKRQEKSEEKKEEKVKDIVVEMNNIEDRIVRLTPNSSDLGSAIITKDGAVSYTHLYGNFSGHRHSFPFPVALYPYTEELWHVLWLLHDIHRSLIHI